MTDLIDEESEMKTFGVQIPIAGHVYVEVEAADEESAIEKALEMDLSIEEANWEALQAFHKGNVCYCPQPWSIEAEEV